MRAQINNIPEKNHVIPLVILQTFNTLQGSYTGQKGGEKHKLLFDFIPLV